MTTQTPAELLAAYVHRVPVGATIPARTPVVSTGSNGALINPDGFSIDVTVHLLDGYTYWTTTPIAAPLPQEPGSLVIAHTERDPRRRPFMRSVGGDWFGGGGGKCWRDADELLDPRPAKAVEVES